MNMNTNGAKRLLIALSMTMLAVPGMAQTIYVDATATGANDGSGWADAYTSLSDALAAATAGEQVWVADGAYGPSAAAGSFDIPTDVAVYGGFAGGETSLAQRDPETFISVIDGFLSQGSPMVTITNGTPGTILDGFQISDAIAADDALGGVGGAGAGMLIMGGSPTIANCNFLGNSARLGGSVFVLDASPVFDTCEFRGNISARSGEGGAVYATTTNATPQTLTFIDSTFVSNSVHQGHFATGNGGGLYVGPGYDLVIDHCSFDGNFAFHNGTFGNAVLGGAVYFGGNHMSVDRSTFSNNYAAFGAGIYAQGTLDCSNSVFTGNRAVINGCFGPECNGAPDVPSGVGGAMYVATATMTNCTVAGNWAAKSNAGCTFGNGTVVNSVLWHNLDYPPLPGEDVPPLVRTQIGGTYTITSSNVQGLLQQIPGEDPPDPANWPGSVDVDPQFVITPVVGTLGGLLVVGDLHLQSGSPSVDSGDNNAVPAGLMLDIDGLSRIADDPNTPDTGMGTAPYVDMGAYEFTPSTTCLPDVNGDGNLDSADFTAWIAAFNANDPAADQNQDGSIDPSDFTAWIANFNAGC